MWGLFDKDEEPGEAKDDVVHNVLLTIFAVVMFCLLVFQGPNS